MINNLSIQNFQSELSPPSSSSSTSTSTLSSPQITRPKNSTGNLPCFSPPVFAKIDEFGSFYVTFNFSDYASKFATSSSRTFDLNDDQSFPSIGIYQNHNSNVLSFFQS